MKRNITFLFLYCLAIACYSQQTTLRQQSYPLAVPMTDENTEWRKDLYREIILTEDQNSALYSPPEWQEEKTVGLFALIMELALSNKLPLYKYEIDGNERFTQKTKVPVSDILDNFHIFYQKDSIGNILVAKNDLPFAEVTAYYVKEALYYDLTNSTFRTQVVAICPVLVMEDEFEEGTTKYPICWLRYDDLQPYIKDFWITDNSNIANSMTVDEFFTLNRYQGKVYKVYNIMGKVLRTDNDSIASLQRDSIDDNLSQMQRRTYNIYHRKKVGQNITPEPPVKTKTRNRWIFPWQKKKAIAAIRKEMEAKEIPLDSTATATKETVTSIKE